MDASIHHDPFAPDKPGLQFSDGSRIEPYAEAGQPAGGGQDPATAQAQEDSADALAPPNRTPGQGPGSPNPEQFPNVELPEPEVDQVAAEAAVAGGGEPESNLRDLPKAHLQDKALAIGVSASGTKEEIASRIEQATPTQETPDVPLT